MHPKKFKLIQTFLSLFALFFLITSLFCYIWIDSNYDQNEIHFVKKQLPTLAFSAGDYSTIDEQFLPLAYKSPRMRTPDLRNHLIYYGLNGRPDASGETQKMHFGLQNGKHLQSITPNEKIYLAFDKKLTTPVKYSFSQENVPTLVWFTASAEDKNAIIHVFMEDEEGHLLSEEEPQTSFALVEKEWTRQATQASGWELGKWRVDGTLLARQKARWVGVDCFLENHGGLEFSQFLGKHRIDFGEGEESYSIFASKGDCFIWENDRWQIVTPGINSLNKPLLSIKKIEDRLMMLELWDTDGKSKLALNLIKMVEPIITQQNLINSFKFLAARTKTRVVFQIDDARMIVRPHDWFILTQEGWRKLKSSEEIDLYVNRKITGPLFVFEEIIKKDDRPMMIGTLYNTGRTEMQTIELAMTPTMASEPQKNIKETMHEDQKLVTQNK